MAITNRWGDAKTVSLVGDDVAVSLRAPARIVSLVETLLVGWSVIAAQVVRPDVVVESHGVKFMVDSVAAEPPRRSSDPIDTVNYVFLCLAYVYVGRQRNCDLLHGAAFQQQGKTSLVFGPKKAGKSTLVFDKAREGARILADDMLIWRSRGQYFEALGIPLRMRRPIPASFRGQALANQVIAGRRLAYSAGSEFDVAPMGTRFMPDEILTLDPDGQCRPVPFYRVARVVRQYTITVGC